MISTDFVAFNHEVPLGDIQGIVVDNSGNIYVGVGFYGKVQVYDSKGRFIRNWKAGASGGSFNIQLSFDQDIVVTTARGDKQILYDQSGKALSTKTIDNIYSESRRTSDRFITKSGEEYRVSGGIFPKITKNSPIEKEIVKQGLILRILQGPLPVWLFAALGIGIVMLLKGGKIKGLSNN